MPAQQSVVSGYDDTPRTPALFISGDDDRQNSFGLERASGSGAGSSSGYEANAGLFGRRGFLVPRSFNPSSTSGSQSRQEFFSFEQGDIRSSTVQLSNLLRAPNVPRPRGASMPHAAENSTLKAWRNQVVNDDMNMFPVAESAPVETNMAGGSPSARMTESRPTTFNGPTSPVSNHEFLDPLVPSSTPRASDPASSTPSGLSLLLARKRELQTPFRKLPGNGGDVPQPDLVGTRPPKDSRHSSSASQGNFEMPMTISEVDEHSETTPLLSDVEAGRPSYHHTTSHSAARRKFFPPSIINKISTLRKTTTYASTWSVLSTFCLVSLQSLPAVILGSLLNILDGVSYGLIMFPTNDVFTNFGGIGVSMFFVTAIISQLVYSFGGSGFPGANGSMMIEVVPFFHIIANMITEEIDVNHPEEVIATTMVAFTFSSVLTGITFWALGYFNLGVVIGFFPRHILLGCIGGVGIFLIETGLTVCARIDESEFSYNLETFRLFFGDMHILSLWLPAFALAILLRIITHKFHHQFIFPAYFVLIPIVFYIVVAIGGFDIHTLRKDGWIFDMGGSSEPWYHFYTLFNLKLTNFGALWATFPTQLALLFFNILHPPLNVPALAVSLGAEVDTNQELRAHGYSNFLAGILGTVPNYLVYVNTLLFYRVGGVTRISGFLLAMFTVLLLVVGTEPIGYIPIILVGALIFVLGIDLAKEALWDNRKRVNWMEYITIVSIMICMTLWDFVVGVVFGIIICCLFFVVQNSQRRSIRSMYSGEFALSAVRRPASHREYIRQVAKQTMIIKLQGFLFFGTITYVEGAIRDLFAAPQWLRSPLRFLVFDFSLVAGVDMSAAEAFVRLQRLLSTRGVTMILCGISSDGVIGKSLLNVGLMEEQLVEVFSTFNDAIEWTENAYLRAWFTSNEDKHLAPPQASTSDLTIPANGNGFSSSHGQLSRSPRDLQVYTAGGQTLARDPTIYWKDSTSDAFATLTKVFSMPESYTKEMFEPLLCCLKKSSFPEGSVLWRQGDEPDALYMLESGVLRASYQFSDIAEVIEESMVGGTVAGELTALSGLPRNATVVVEEAAVLWRLEVPDLKRLEDNHPQLARTFLTLVLRAAKTDFDFLLASLAHKQ